MGGADIVITVDAQKGSSTIYKLSKDIQNMKQKAEQPIVVKFDKATNYIKEEANNTIWGAARNFGKWIRSLHIYGIDPLTRGFAKFGSTVLGAFIHPVTLAATAAMFLFTQLKKVILTSDDLIAKNDSVVKSIDKKVSKLEKEKKSFDEVIDKVKELQKQNKKLTASEHQLALTYAHRLQQKGLINRDIEFDTNGRISNLDAISEEAYNNASEKLIEQLNKKDERIASSLDLLLSKFFHWSDKNSEYFRTGQVDPSMNVQKLLPWIQKLTKTQIQNARAQLDITKLYSGNLQMQYQFFQDLKNYTKDRDKVDTLDKILQFLETKMDIKDKIESIINGIDKTEEQLKNVDRGFKELTDIQKKINDKNTLHKEQMKDLRYKERTSGMTTRQRAEEEQKKAMIASIEVTKARKQIADKQAKLASKGWIKNKNGQVTNSILDNMLQRTPKLRELDKQIKQFQKERDEQIRDNLKGSLEFINNPYNQKRQAMLGQWDESTWSEDDKEFMKMMRGQRISALQARTNANETFNKRTEKLFSQVKQLLGENADTYLTLREQTEDAKKEWQQIQKLTINAAKNQKTWIQSRTSSKQLFKQADKEDADRLKRENRFWQNIINPQLKNTVKNSNAAAAVRYQELLKDLEEVKGKQNITEFDRERLKNASKLEDVNRQIQDILSKEQYTIKSDQFARKGGGYDFYVAQLNPMKSVENLEKQQVQLLKQLVNINQVNGETFAQGIIFR